jgi:hypothetical protein
MPVYCCAVLLPSSLLLFVIHYKYEAVDVEERLQSRRPDATSAQLSVAGLLCVLSGIAEWLL